MSSAAQVPPELRAAVARGGKPLILGPSQASLRDRIHVICKIPPGEQALNPPLSLARKITQEEDEAGGVFTRVQADGLVITDADNAVWSGKREAQVAKTAQFVMIDRDTHFELLPVTATYAFARDLTRVVGRQEAVDLERKQRLMMARDHAADMAIANRKRANEADDDDDADEHGLGSKKLRTSADDAYGQAMSVTAEKKAKLRKLLRRKRAAVDLDIGETAGSSLAFGEVRKAENDWDFDDEGVATDDEEQAVMSDHEAVEEEVQDVEDSEEEKEEVVLTNFGENLSRMLENQKEVEANDELAQFSDEEDDELGARVSSGSGTSLAAAEPAAAPLDPSAQNEAQIRDTIVSLLMASEGHQISVKGLLESVGVTAKNSKFHLVKKVIGEVCELKAEGGVKYFQLKK